MTGERVSEKIYGKPFNAVETVLVDTGYTVDRSAVTIVKFERD